MENSVYGALAPVRRRQRLAFVLRAAALGLLAGAVAAGLVGLARWGVAAEAGSLRGRLAVLSFLSDWASAWLSPAALVLAYLAAGPVLGALAGLCWRLGWHPAAAAVDLHYSLKDRAVTALDFARRPEHTDLQTLQIGDAVEHLRRVEPRAVVPVRAPRLLALAGLAAGVALVLGLWPVGTPQADAGPPEPLPQVVAEAERLRESLEDLEEAARQDENKELEKLVEELRQKLEEMKQPGIDEREALAKLSEMQAAVQAQQAQYNTALVDGKLQSLGTAMCAATPLEGAGKALQESKLEKAAQELEKLEDPQLNRKEARAVEEKLKQVAREMGEVGLGQLSGAVSDFAESLKGGKGKGKKATRVLAREVKNQARRKRVNDLLNAEVDRLQEGKNEIQANSMVKGKKPEKSTSPSSTFGMTTSGNVQGDMTKLLGQRNQVDITGTPGEGPSDVETTASPEARQQAQRGYREVYQKYRKMSDAVLDSEPIPLGHRQTIRRYFELIRPQNSEEPAGKPEAGKPSKP
jgi:hypothetical protein